MRQAKPAPTLPPHRGKAQGDSTAEDQLDTQAHDLESAEEPITPVPNTGTCEEPPADEPFQAPEPLEDDETGE